MKRILSIIFALALMGSWCQTVKAQTETTPTYIAPTVTSTEGYDFYVAFLPNGERFSDAKELKLQLLISSSTVEGYPDITENIVGIGYADGSTQEIKVPFGETKVFDVDAKEAYWDKGEDIETALNKGVHVYSKNGVKMTVFATNQIGTDVATYSLDGSHILPRQALGFEYIVECNSRDKMSTEFVIMSTKVNTTVTINLPAGVKTSTGGKSKLTAKLTKPYQVYIVRSQLGGDPNDATNPNGNLNVDLSGTTICSNEPIAVWGGNQQAYVPADLPGSDDHTYDQLLPIDRWGTRFIVPLTGQHMAINQVDMVAREDGTQVKVTTKKGTETYTLNQAEKRSRASRAPFGGNIEDSTLVIEASAPIQVYLFTSVAMANPYAGSGGTTTYQGDPSMTMIAPIEYAVDSLIFSTYTNLPLSQELIVWAKSSTISSLKLDGVLVAASSFQAVPGAAPFTNYKYARIPISAGTHTLTAKEKGFGGYIDGLETGQASLFPIGYRFLPQEDSLILADEHQEIQVIRSEYSKKNPDKGGWYLNREILPGKIILDSIFVCDSTLLRFPMIIHNEWDTIVWSVERVNPSNQKRTAYTGDIDEENPAKNKRKTGMLPNPFLETMLAVQPEKNKYAYARSKFEDFEIRAVLFRQPKLCGGTDIRYWQKDTLNTIVRVYREYNDTTWMMKCTTDRTFTFFSDLADDGETMTPTTFYCVPNSVPADADPKWNKQLVLGENIFVNGPNGELKPYVSVNGCDSISVLKVYLCQSYSETIQKYNFCEADLPALQTELDRFFTENNPIDFAETLRNSKKGASNVWSKENTGTWRFRSNPQKSTLKASGCDDEWDIYKEEAAKYLNDNRGSSVKNFKRCDSVLVLEMHVIPMDEYDYGKQTFCGTTYAWKDDNGNLLENIPRQSIGVEKEYIHDIKYDAPDEWKGCIHERHILKLAFINPSEILEETIEVCADAGVQTYPRADAQGDHTWTFDPTGKAGQTIQGEVIDYTNPDGCNYKFRYVFHVNEVPVTRDTVVYCYEEGATKFTHEWDGHASFWWNLKGDAKKTRTASLTGNYPAPPADKDHDTRVIYELADTLETAKGCHDIYYRVLVIMPQYSTKEEHASITTEQYFSWAGITWAGENTTISGTNVVKLLPEGGTYPAGWTVDYDPTTCRYTMTKTGNTKPIYAQKCDSTFSMSVQVGRIFRDTTYTYACGNGAFDWIDQNGDHHNVDITTPAVTKPEVRTYYDSLKTTYPVPDLDSIWVLVLTVYPSYIYPHEDVTCQSLAGYKWAGHMGEGHDLWINGRQMSPSWDSIPTSQFGVFTIEDKLLTKPRNYTHPETGETVEVRCDSSEVLTLTINPSYTKDLNKETVTFKAGVATNDTVGFFENPRILYYGADYDFDAHGTSLAELQAQYGAGNVQKVSLTTGVDVDTLHFEQKLTTIHGCDSITFLDLRLVRTYINEYTTLHLGDNVTDYTFGYVDPFGNPLHPNNYKTGDYFHYYYDEVTGERLDPVQYDDPDKPKDVRIFHFEDTVQTASGADSIIRQTVYIYPSYRILDKVDVTCFNDQYNWDVYDPETGTTHHWENLNELTTDPLTMMTEFGDTLHVMQYRSVGRFDSIRVLQLTILPGRTVFSKDSFCMNETHVWRQQVIEYKWDDPIYKVLDEVTIPGYESCKTIFQFDIKWNPTYGFAGAKDLDDWIDTDEACQYDPYNWIDEATGKAHKTNLRDKFGNKYKEIPTNYSKDFFDDLADSQDAGGWWITMYDSLKTKECGCDSIHTLKLYIKRAFRDSTVQNMCIGDVYHWTAGSEVRTYEASELGLGDFHDEIHGTGANGCDSSYYLDIHVDSMYLDTIHVVLCASDEHFEWHGTVYDSYLADSRNWTDSLALYQRFDTVTKISNCDSTTVLHLTIGPSKDSVWTDTICVGEKYLFYDQEITDPGTYHSTHANKWGCTVNYELKLDTVPPTKFEVQTDHVCVQNTGIGETYTIQYNYEGEFAPITYNVRYDSVAHAAGFVDQIDIPIPVAQADQVEGVIYDLEIPTPVFAARENYPRPGHYNASIGFTNGVCRDDSLMKYTIDVVVNYPAWIIEQRFGDVIAILNDEKNGGYTWTEYQWYQGDTKLQGQTQPYLYIPTGLEVGEEYYVVLSREGDKESFATCPIIIKADPTANKPMPTMGYLSVVPTCVPVNYPYANILSRHPGTYRISTTDGILVREGSFKADVTQISIPTTAGMYVVQLWSDDTPEEPYRAIKILVSNQCEMCATSF